VRVTRAARELGDEFAPPRPVPQRAWTAAHRYFHPAAADLDLVNAHSARNTLAAARTWPAGRLADKACPAGLPAMADVSAHTDPTPQHEDE